MMSVVVRFAPRHTTDQYDDAVRRLDGSGELSPEGMEYHVCYLADGNLRVDEIWASPEQYKGGCGKRSQLLAEIGIDAGRPQILEIHNIVRS